MKHSDIFYIDYFGNDYLASLIGSFVMVNALYKRQKMIFEKNEIK